MGNSVQGGSGTKLTGRVIEMKCHEIITQAWEDWGAQADPWQTLTRRIERCKKGLQRWQINKVGYSNTDSI